MPTPGAVSGPQVVCPGSVTTYVLPPLQGTKIEYDWKGLPPGANFASPNGAPVISIDWGTAAPGTYPIEVEVSNTCKSKSAFINITLLPQKPPIPGPVFGPNDVCPGEISVYQTGSVPNANYIWSGLPSHAQIIQNNGNSITVDWGNWAHLQGKTVQLALTLQNICGSSSISKRFACANPNQTRRSI